MSDHPRLSNLGTTTQILKQAASTFNSNPISFLFLSFLLFSFRTFVENGSFLLTAYIDRDPSLKSLLSRLDLAGNYPHHHPHHRLHGQQPAHLRRRHRPFLHLTRVGTLDDDFFSGDDDPNRSPFSNHRRDQPNGTLVILSVSRPGSGFSPNCVDNGLRYPEIVRPGVQFRADDRLFRSDEDVGEKKNADGEEQEEEMRSEKEFDRIVDFQFFIRGLELGRHDAAAFFFLVSFLSAAYGWVILGFLVTYSWVFGSVFVAVVNNVLGRFSSLIGVLWQGSRLGLKRLSGFILMRWAVRDALTQMLGLWYFGEIEDQYSFFKLFVRLKLMPFSVMLPWTRGFEKEISAFLFVWFLLDTFIAFVFVVDAWIAIVDSRKSGKEIIKEGCYLVLTMWNQAIQLKCLEAIVCGTFVRWALGRVGGKVFASVFQSTMEVFFMVAWLFFYLATRCRDADSNGRRFEIRELETVVQGLR
ncbi:hypothetical protein BT93_A1069 [Corymbia citriodora subsp. variegata]|nr:hypothetical protein BT93_A1069 [Corymbia citriodora subsp. variegata]